MGVDNKDTKHFSRDKKPALALTDPAGYENSERETELEFTKTHPTVMQVEL